MSNYRNVLPRRAHRERSQPLARAHLGELEHHGDYVKRAKDYHRKQDTLQKLREKAALRNPDEFYHRMINERTVNGEHVVENPRGKRTAQTLSRMKLQDQAYLQMKKQEDERAVDKLKQSMHGISTASTAPSNHHVIFCDDEKQVLHFDPVKHFQTAPQLVNQTHNRLRIDQLQSGSVIVNKTSLEQTKQSLKRIEKLQRVTLESLNDRLTRKRKIDELHQRVSQQRLLMTKGKRFKKVVYDKFGDVDESKTTFKWKQERKR